ncbi:hypothetical protein BGZ49_007665 [Haplosporangium sp. Z 27]|nr:hypothetical protein BGZ49_007665 [Haplosporangium sp. Z 27]
MSVPGSTSGGASFECSLTGTVIPGQFRHLYDRLLGLCEHAAHSKMFEHEMLFTPAIQRQIYAPRNDDVHLRLRVKMTVLDQVKKNQHGIQDGSDSNQRKKLKSSNNGTNGNSTSEVNKSEDTEMVSTTQEEAVNKAQQPSVDETGKAIDASSQPSEELSKGDSLSQKGYESKTVVTRQYQLCQYGHPEPGRTIVVRSAILVKIHGDAFGFLSLLGYGFEDEFVRRGYNFMFNNICRISVFRKYKLSQQHDPFSSIVPEQESSGGAADTSSPWLVEITSSFVSQENVNTMSEEINGVRNLLAGSVTF